MDTTITSTDTAGDIPHVLDDLVNDDLSYGGLQSGVLNDGRLGVNSVESGVGDDSWRYSQGSTLPTLDAGKNLRGNNEKFYRYEPLPNSRTIRILVVEPGSELSKLRGHLETVDLTRNPRYRAISYTWGAAERNEVIICNGLKLPTISNALSALRKIRKEDEQVSVWIDSICIDQGNLAERGQQVSLMTSIFQQAEEVMIWLNMKGARRVQGGFQLIEDIHAAFEPVETILEYPHPPRHFFISSNAQRFRLTYNDHNLFHLRTILKHPWFSRIWVLQEAGFARSARLLCGRSEVQWNKVVFVAAFLSAQKAYFRSKLGIIPSKVLSMTRRFWQGDDGLDFLQLLTHARQQRATDPRDKVYALLSHPSARLSPMAESPIRADYEKPPPQLWLEIVTSFLQQTNQPLRILSAVQHPYEMAGPRDSNKDAVAAEGNPDRAVSTSAPLLHPTWAPQWDVFQMRSVFGLLSRYKAAADTEARFSICEEKQELGVDGIRFDDVTFTSRVMRVSHFFKDHKAEKDPVTSIWDELCGEEGLSPTYPTDANSWRAYCTTLTADNYCWFNAGQSHALVPDNDLDQSLAALWDDFLSGGYARMVQRPWGELVDSERDEDKPMLFFLEQASVACQCRRFFVTRTGYFGLGPAVMQPGDNVVVFFGSSVPFVVRRCSGKWNLIGECYVHGIMNGELIDSWRNGEVGPEKFHII